MAISELQNSYEMKETKNGREVIRKFRMTWRDYNGSSLTPFRILVGDKLYNDNEMRVTNIDVYPTRNNNDYCDVLVTYSSDSWRFPDKRPNEQFSWRDNLAVSIAERVVTHYYDESSGTQKVWADEYTGDGATPALVKVTPESVYQVTCYGSTLHLARIVQYVRYVNSSNFLSRIFASRSDINDDTSGYSDVGLWMFTGADVQRVRDDCWEHRFIFTYNSDGWNSQHGQTVSLYPTMDLTYLFNDMRDVNNYSLIGGR